MSSPQRTGQAAPARPPLRELPSFVLPPELPVSARAEDIVRAIASSQVVVISGETGSGKTTQLPKLAWLAGCGRRAVIGHTQPRRIAASSVAKRIAQELGSPLGEHVGYKVRFSDTSQPGAPIKLMTDGILLAESQGDPLLSGYDTLILDEAHERSLNIDFLLGYLKRLLSGPRQHDLKLIITSATIDAQRFAKYFTRDDGPEVPMLEVSGRTYPVQIRYRNYAEHAEDDEDTSTPSQVQDAIEELWREASGDVLVFLPGEREIRECADHLQRSVARARAVRGAHSVLGRGPVDVLPLYSRLSVADQDKVFSTSNGRRIVLATNVAETSLTVPGIRYVVDTGLARIKRYRYRGKVEELHIEPISQAAANQRAGRCGRVADGICIRLFDEAEFLARPRYTDPEVLRSSLAGVILRMRALGLGQVEAFEFLDQPSRRAIMDGKELLLEIDAMTPLGELTATGKQLAQLPLDPRIGRMLLEARARDCVRELLIIASALSSQDPRERPLQAQQASDQQHKRFADERSDFLGLVKLWDYWRELVDQRTALGLSHRQLAQRLEREFLSNRKLREWADVHSQLTQTVQGLGWRINAEPASFEAVHRALLSGLLGNLGTKSPEDAHYSGTHAVKFQLHPASSLARKTPRWVMASELVDTGRLLARMAASVDPVWIEAAAGHLLVRSHSDAHWSLKSGQAQIYERATLYGLTLYAQRRVALAPLDREAARELMIREALVHHAWPETGLRAPHFVAHNRKLIESIEQLEHRIRRPDLLVDEDFLFEWFDRRIPAEVVQLRDLAQRCERGELDLALSRDVLLRRSADDAQDRSFPRQIRMHGTTFEARYRFDPGAADDGVTLVVPLATLNQVDDRQAQWLVPGLLPDKVIATLKSLPQRLRRVLVPIADYAQGFLDRLDAGEESARRLPLVQALIADIQGQGHRAPLPQDFQLEQVPAHLMMRFEVVDQHGRVLGASRSLAQLRSDLGGQALNAFQSALAGVLGEASRTQRAPISAPAKPSTASSAPSSAPGAVALAAPPSQTWSFGALPELMEIEQNGAQLLGYPAVVPSGEGVVLQVFDDPQQAAQQHELGLSLLFRLALKEVLRQWTKSIAGSTQLALAYHHFGDAQALQEDLTTAVLKRACLAEPLPRDAASFSQRLAESRPRITPIGQELVRLLQTILQEAQIVQRKLGMLKGNPAALADIEAQIAWLMPRRFAASAPAHAWTHLPRYLRGIAMRIDKLREDPARDAQLQASFSALQGQWTKRNQQARGQDPRIQAFGWQLQELRVSLFAQTLKTPMPVSVKRLDKAWAALVQQLH